MSRRRICLVLLVALGVGSALLLGAPGAQAKGVLGTGIGPTVGPDLNPLPSIGELLNGVVNGLFGALLSALTPSFLKHADIHALEWLVALPNVADTAIWPTVGRLEANMVWVAGAILPTTLIIATTRDTALSLSFRAHPGNALLRVVGAVFWLILYRFAVSNAVAFVNVLTHTMLSWSIVAQGLHRTVLVMFGGSVILGAGGAFLALLGLVALVFAVCLFALKVLLLMVLAVLFVAGPLLIALTPLPTVGYLARGWLLALVGICLIPVGWCIIFATAGAISLDVTNLGGGAHIGNRVVGAFAALATFYIAVKWPLMVLGHVRGSLGGLGVRPGASSAVGSVVSDGALAAKAQRARTGLQAAMQAGGRGIGLAAGALGAPRGGLAGLAARQARPHLAGAAASGAIAVGPPRARPRPTAAPGRIAQAGEALRDTPTRMRDAWRAAGEPPTRGGASGAHARPGRRKGSRRAGGRSRKVPSGGGQPRAGRSGSPASADPGPTSSRASRRAPLVPQAASHQVKAPTAPVSPSGNADPRRNKTAGAQVSSTARPRGGGARLGDSRSVAPRPASEQPPRPAPSHARASRAPAPSQRNRSSRRSPAGNRPRKGRKG
jgi:hypothetical protein